MRIPRRRLQTRRRLKSLWLGQHPKEKMSTETSVRLSLSHHHTVGFRGFFEDDFVFTVSGLCWRSLSELHQRREALTAPGATTAYGRPSQAAGTCTETVSLTRTSGWANASCIKVRTRKYWKFASLNFWRSTAAEAALATDALRTLRRPPAPLARCPPHPRRHLGPILVSSHSAVFGNEPPAQGAGDRTPSSLRCGLLLCKLFSLAFGARAPRPPPLASQPRHYELYGI